MKNNYKKWIFSSFALILVFVIALSSIVYIIDPFFQFRVKDNSYMINARFSGAGLIKNYDYDTLIIGSSMTQNFNMDIFREELNVKPLHIGIGGIRTTEETALLELAYKIGRAKKYYICAEPHLFTADSKECRIPKYIINEDFLSRCRYFLNYEAWFRYIPVDLGFMFIDKLGIRSPKKLQFQKSIDHLENWSLDFEFGEDVVLTNYKNSKYGVSSVEMDDLYNKMKKRIDDYFDILKTDKGEHIFFFAPYSMLYWADQSDELTEILMEAERYFVGKAMEKGITVYNFHSAELTMDLNNYKDTTHYTPQVNDWMVKNFKTSEYVINLENFDEFKNNLINMKNEFRIKYANIFNN